MQIIDVHNKETPTLGKMHPETVDLICASISINSSYASQVVAPKKSGELAQQLGNKTECALLGFVLSLDQSYQTIREQYPEEAIVKVFTFNSIRKSMSTVIKKTHDTQGGYRVFAKGASEIILKKFVI
jgi:Ca2+ transporting ATPase